MSVARNSLVAPAQPAVATGGIASGLGRILSIIGMALGGIATNKGRTALTLLGMIIGVASVITAMGIGAGQSAQITNQINSLGTNLVEVQPGATNSGGVRGAIGSASTLTQADVDALSGSLGANGPLPDVSEIVPEATTSVQVVYGANNTGGSADGVTPAYQAARNMDLVQGRFITQDDVDRSSQVAVLGGTLAQTINAPVGATIQLNGQSYQVVGILAVKGGFGNADNNAFVPITAVQNRLALKPGSPPSVSDINVVATSGDTTNAAQAEVEALLRRIHKLQPTQSDDFSFFNQTSIQQTASNVSGSLTVLLTAIAAVALLVAGIGIMNIMLVTVTERTREIGLRKAVGARRGDILGQFLLEATLISVLGGFIGIVLSYALAFLLPMVTSGTSGVTAVHPIITTSSVVLAAGVSLGIGLFFGGYPASRAARLDPIQALRYE